MFGTCVAIFITVTTGHNQLLLLDACKVDRLIPVPVTRHEFKNAKCQAIIGSTGSFLADSCVDIEFKIKQALQKFQDDTRTASRHVDPVR